MMKHPRSWSALAAGLSALTVLALAGRAASAEGPRAPVSLQGAGATFPAPLYAKWVAVYNASEQGARVDYQPIGSGGGIKGITDRTIDFGASDAPLTEEQLGAAPGKLLHIPTVSGPVVLAYNLGDVRQLTLDGATLAGIYLGEITNWSDPKLAALNAGVRLPNLDIIVVHRSDGSGTSWIFTNYLSKVSPVWKTRVGNATSVKWPVGIGGKGNPGVAQEVKNTEGAIGYLELAYAESAKLHFAAQINRAGKPVRASVPSVVEAAANSAESIPEDLRITITDAPGDGSYPICGFTFLLIYEDLSYFNDANKARELVRFIYWCCHQGQEMAKDLQYARLPQALQKKVAEKLATVSFKGKPASAD
jgi:phosphate transport system substrate-binding protein